jgi:putative endonuclease
VKGAEPKHPENVSSIHAASKAFSRGCLCYHLADAGRPFLHVLGLHHGEPYRHSVHWTGYFETRIAQHKTGAVEGFSKKHGCNRLVYFETHDDVAKAIGREKQLKGWRRERKIALIEKVKPRWEDLAENWGRQMLFPGQSIKRTPSSGMPPGAS